MHRQHERAAAGLVAIHRALERSRPLAGAEEEFLGLYRWVAGADPEAFTKVWLDPSSHYWTSLAYRRLGALLGEIRAKGAASEGLQQSLLEALERFKAIALGVAISAKRDLAFDRPWRPPLPLAIPGTRLTVVGAPGGTIQGVGSGSIAFGNQAAIAFEECPVVRRGECEILLKPSAFDLPEFEFSLPLRDLPNRFQAEQVAVMARALEIIERHRPEVFADLSGLMRVVAFKPEELGDFSNVTAAELPGACILNAFGDPYVLAAVFIHEFYHNKLFLIEDEGDLLEKGPALLGREGEYYSPFREDLRPVGGLLHGLYVFVPTLDYWIAVHRSGELSGDRARFAATRIPHMLGQLEIALFQLERHARLSARGRSLLGTLKERIANLGHEVDRLRLPKDEPLLAVVRAGGFTRESDPDDGHAMTPREALLKHLDRFDVRAQCAEMRASLRAA